MVSILDMKYLKPNVGFKRVLHTLNAFECYKQFYANSFMLKMSQLEQLLNKQFGIFYFIRIKNNTKIKQKCYGYF